MGRGLGRKGLYIEFSEYEHGEYAAVWYTKEPKDNACSLCIRYYVANHAKLHAMESESGFMRLVVFSFFFFPFPLPWNAHLMYSAALPSNTWHYAAFK